MSGLLMGILLSRTISGFVGAHFGWRAMFYIAAGIMVVIWLLLFLLLPEVEPEYNGTYKALDEIAGHFNKERAGIAYCVVAGCAVFCLLHGFLDDLDFFAERNFNKGSDIAGLFGLVGAFGAIAAGLMGTAKR